MPRAKIEIHQPELEPAVADATAFVSSGSTLLDLVLGGGWAQGRVVNVVGDKSTGKTLLLIEAMGNFARVTTKDRLRYKEAEAAFNEEYAKTMGLPADVLGLDEGLNTVEEFDADLGAWLDGLRGNAPALYGLDSLDSLSSEDEMKKEITEGTYGTERARMMSKMFRRKIRQIEEKNATLFIISQIRDKLNVTFGETKTRSGGRALDFYASQVIWLAEIGKIKRTFAGIERVIGLTIQAKNKKNKVGVAWRDAELDLIFNYGIDDEASMIKWLKKAKSSWPGQTTPEQYTSMLGDARRRQDRNAVAEINRELRRMTIDRWLQIEQELQPPMSKYGD